MLEKMVSGCHLVAKKTTKTSELRYPPPPPLPFILEVIQKASNPLHTSM